MNMCVTESHNSTSEMLPTQSYHKESSYSVDDDVFSSNVSKNNENAPGKYLSYSLAISNVIYSLCEVTFYGMLDVVNGWCTGLSTALLSSVLIAHDSYSYITTETHGKSLDPIH